MTLRMPPRMATWLLQHLGPAYHSESLAGDLHEEYQLERTRAWYWRQVFVAVGIGWLARTRKLAEHLSAIVRRPVQRLATSTVILFSTEAAALLGAVALAEKIRMTCPWGRTADAGGFMTLLGGVGLCLSIGLYLSLCRRPASTGAPPAHRQQARRFRNTAPIRRLIGVFAVTALSAGTLTWASGTSHTRRQCSHSSSAALPASSDLVRDDVNRK